MSCLCTSGSLASYALCNSYTMRAKAASVLSARAQGRELIKTDACLCMHGTTRDILLEGLETLWDYACCNALWQVACFTLEQYKIVSLSTLILKL